MAAVFCKLESILQSYLIAIGGVDQHLRILQFNQESSAILPFLSLKHDAKINSVAWNLTNDSLLAALLDDGTVQLVNVNIYYSIIIFC
jgi:WD40 repeat protein